MRNPRLRHPRGVEHRGAQIGARTRATAGRHPREITAYRHQPGRDSRAQRRIIDSVEDGIGMALPARPVAPHMVVIARHRPRARPQRGIAHPRQRMRMQDRARIDSDRQPGA